MEPKFIILQNGDIVNFNDILYIHPSKTQEKAMLYIKHLYHSSSLPETVNTIKSKMITISLDDYDYILNAIKTVPSLHLTIPNK